MRSRLAPPNSWAPSRGCAESIASGYLTSRLELAIVASIKSVARIRPLHPIALAAAVAAAGLSSLAFAVAASATDENYNCFTHGSFKCYIAYGENNYITNDYGISYTHNGVCADTVKRNPFGIWARRCTSGNEVLTCNGGEYEIYGYGETVDTEGPKEQNLAGTQNNYHYCTRK